MCESMEGSSVLDLFCFGLFDLAQWKLVKVQFLGGGVEMILLLNLVNECH